MIYCRWIVYFLVCYDDVMICIPYPLCMDVVDGQLSPVI